jgi:hypothetical protein
MILQGQGQCTNNVFVHGTSPLDHTLLHNFIILSLARKKICKWKYLKATYLVRTQIKEIIMQDQVACTNNVFVHDTRYYMIIAITHGATNCDHRQQHVMRASYLHWAHKPYGCCWRTKKNAQHIFFYKALGLTNTTPWTNCPRSIIGQIH